MTADARSRKDDGQPGGYECVDPPRGRLLWEPPHELDDEQRRQLELHLGVCDHCRLEAAAEAELASGLRSGALRFKRPGLPTVWSFAAPAGAVLAAACLTLMLVLPPRARLDEVALRDDAVATRFITPVEGQVLTGDRVVLAWSPVAGATSYRVTVELVGGERSWQWETESTRQPVAVEGGLPRAPYRAHLEAIPAYLLAGERVSVRFAVGTRPSVLGYRVTSAAWWVWALGIAGSICLAAAGLRRWRRRRSISF